MPAKHLVLGLDGADLSVIRALGSATTPALHAAMHAGAYAHQRSVMPPATLPNWTTFLTGVDPGRHGVFDFTQRAGERVKFVGGTVREAPTIFARLDAMGRSCAALFFPATYPPERLEHGVFVSGWDSPVAFRADASFVHPRSLHATLVERFGEIRFDDVDEFDADREGWHAALAPALERRIARKVELARFLLDARDWDLFAIYFGELDTASHHLFAHHDPKSPRHPGPSDASDGLERVHRAIDAAVADVVAHAGGDAVELTILSDHGSGPSSDRVLYLNRALADAGLLRFAPSARSGRALSALKDVALTKLTPSLRERVFRFAGNTLPSWLEGRNRFGAIDFEGTRAFSDELSYFPAIHFNVRGREPRGTVDPSELTSLSREVESALLAIRTPGDGRPVVARVHRREDLYEGPWVERAPDLVLELALDGDASFNLVRSVGPGPTIETLPVSEHVGRKGRSLPGAHRPKGLYVARGPSIADVGEIETDIADATATLLARMGVAVPADFRGRVLFEAFREFGGRSLEALADAAVVTGRARHDEAAIERRLRALGYVE